MQYYFMINAKLPSLNEYIAKINSNRHTGNKFKQETEEIIQWAIIDAKAKKMLKPTCKPCKVAFEWHERTAKRDCDNIASAKKFILDALQKQGIIPNDNQKYIKGFTDTFIKDKSDYVIVKLIELEE